MTDYRGAHDLWARTAWAAIDAAKRSGLPMDGFYDNLPFDDETLRRIRRIDWVDYCIVCEEIQERAGGPEGLHRMLAESYHHVVPEIRAVAGSLVSAKALYRVLMEVIDPILLQPLTMSYEELGEDHIRVGFRCRPGARPCEAFFRGSVGAVEGFTGHLDLPPPKFLSTHVTPTEGIFELLLPPSNTLAARFKRASRARIERFFAPWVLGYTSDGSPIGASFGGTSAGDDIEARIVAAAQKWELTARQAEVLGLLARGRSNKEIASDLSCAENTVELHVTHLFKKSGATSRAQLIARFWSEL